MKRLSSFLALTLSSILLSSSAIGAVIYVSPSGSSTAPYGSWADAAVDLQDALGVASSGDEIWVAAGTYIPGSLRTDKYQLVAGVSLYGGFNGTETTRSERDWNANETILSGDIAGTPGDYTDNSLCLLRGADDAILDGFTVTGAYSDTGASYGAMHLATSVDVTVRNCRVMAIFVRFKRGTVQ